jgi:threonine aldolase
VLELESAMAAMLGKERAVFMPTGTLTNHLAIRALAVKGSRVLVQERSHIYQDSGDALTAISGFNLIPLGHHRVHYMLEEAKSAHADAGQTRVKTDIGALSIECKRPAIPS